MGVFILHQWGRLLALTSGCFVVWAGLWGLFYRKFFWDMLGGTVGPAGLVPPPSAKFFIMTIVDAPIFQIINIANGVLTLALEWPLPFIVGTAMHRWLMARAVFYFWSAFFAMFPYQTIDAGVFYLITSIVFARAAQIGESVASKEVQTASDMV
ncbi:hypothetical protein BCR35DRAFT_333553 [Leucosporidium creatinivorum]|uniref:DUF7727 domain-containing protein n=1 Tax=Leucosporidium creatinivorum TaxID=106004 RepID=A0A1Y2EQH3_9BASI|nr:hypothetical protein BCR35DRAFT_333553 [Leucosporidium creatinivorum]